LTGSRSSWSELGLQLSAVGTLNAAGPAGANSLEVRAATSPVGLFVELAPRDLTADPAVSYSLRLDADGTGDNWLTLLIDPGGVRLRDWRGATPGTAPAALQLSGARFELERGSGPAGSLQLYVPLATLGDRLPLRIRAQSY